MGLLTLAISVLVALAGAAAWLSYHAQVAYMLAHNGNQRTEGQIWALLLDTGTVGVSLLRLHETLRRRSSAATRVSLLGCITASVVLNLLHTPTRTPGGYLVAAVPPVMYAVFLEHLLTNLRNLLVSDEARHSMWRVSALWIHFPLLMWNGLRGSLRFDAEGMLTASEPAPCTCSISQDPVSNDEEVEQANNTCEAPQKQPSPLPSRRGRGPGPKRVAFEAALENQVRSGDLRLFSGDERERNAAAYQAAATLPAPLSRGAARRYVVQALPRLEEGGELFALPPRASSLE